MIILHSYPLKPNLEDLSSISFPKGLHRGWQDWCLVEAEARMGPLEQMLL